MRNFTLALLVLVPFFAGSAFADFNGTWAGADGYVSGPLSGNCSPIQVHISQTDLILTVAIDPYTCSGNYMDNAMTFTFDIVGGVLMYQGQVVGAFAPNTFTYSFAGTDASGTVRANGTWSFIADGSNLIFSENFWLIGGGGYNHVLSHLTKE